MAKLAQAIETLTSGPRLIGPYRLVRQLGKGGFAPVWLAEEVYGETVLRTAAVKLFAIGRGALLDVASGSGGGGMAYREHVIEEARAICRVEHPNIVRFYAIATDAEHGVVGLAMEHVAGKALDRRLAEVDALPVDELTSLGAAIASALAAVHRAGLVHRDVKPANVVDAHGVYKLIDFGIASATRPDAAGLRTEAATSIDGVPIVTPTAPDRCGTLGYMDPALEAGGPATPASDLYALGALLFECATGVLPAADTAQGGLDHEVLSGHARPPSVAVRVPSLPASLAALIDSLVDPSVEKRPRSAEAVAIELERIRAEFAGRKRALPPEDIGPFRGLGRFEEGDRDVFFGRGAEVAAVLELLRTRSLVALVGASGSGKSSLARAGVLPALAEGKLAGAKAPWRTIVVAPGVDPRRTFAEAFADLVPGLADRPAEDAAAAVLTAAAATGHGLVLLVDQLEELVTASTANARDWAATFLAELGERAIAGVRVLVAARQDLITPLYALGRFGRTLSRGSFIVAPMSEAAWGDVVDAALSAYGYRFESDALRSEVLAALEGAERAMPLFEFALTRLWEHRSRAKKLISREGLDAIGGIAGALERHADQALESIAAIGPEAPEVARSVLLALTTLQGTRATRSEVELLALGPGDVARKVLARLDAERLVVREPVGITLSHEALLTTWTQLVDWVRGARKVRELVEEVGLDAARWRLRGQPVDMLWRGTRLVDADALAGADLGPASDFLDASRRAVRRERRARWAYAAAAFVGASVLLAGFSFASYRFTVRQRAEQAKAEAATADAKRAIREADKLRAATEKATKELEASALVAKNEAALAKADADAAKADALNAKEEALRIRQTAMTQVAAANRAADAVTSDAAARRQAEQAALAGVAAGK